MHLREVCTEVLRDLFEAVWAIAVASDATDHVSTMLHLAFSVIAVGNSLLAYLDT